MQDNQNTIRWGIIGVGNVCEKKSGPAFAKLPYSQLVAVMRRTPGLAKEYALRHGVPDYYEHVEDILNHSSVNAIYIATPPAFHEEYALAAMQAGKAVYIEKPVTLTAAGCEHLITAANQYNVSVSVAHYRRRLPLFIKVKELLESGAIGQPRHIELRLFQAKTKNIIASSDENWRIVPTLSGGGFFHDLAPHQLDILYWLFGKVKSVNGYSMNKGGTYEAPDFTHLEAQFDVPLTLSATWSFSEPERSIEDRCEIFGSHGKLEFAFFRNPLLILKNQDGEEQWELTYPEHVQQPMIADVVRYFRGEIKNPCSLEEALASMQIMDAVSNKV